MSEQTRQTTTERGTAGAGGNSSAERSPDQIERDIKVTREHLAGTIDAIGDRVAPKNIARRTLDSVKAQFVHPNGSLRTERVAPIVGFVVVVASIRGVVMWRHHRR